MGVGTTCLVNGLLSFGWHKVGRGCFFRKVTEYFTNSHLSKTGFHWSMFSKENTKLPESMKKVILDQ